MKFASKRVRIRLFQRDGMARGGAGRAWMTATPLRDAMRWPTKGAGRCMADLALRAGARNRHSVAASGRSWEGGRRRSMPPVGVISLRARAFDAKSNIVNASHGPVTAGLRGLCLTKRESARRRRLLSRQAVGITASGRLVRTQNPKTLPGRIHDQIRRKIAQESGLPFARSSERAAPSARTMAGGASFVRWCAGGADMARRGVRSDPSRE